MQILDNAELTRRLLLLENAVMAGKSREVGNTYRSEDADNKVSNTIPQVNKNTSDISDTTNGLVDLADITDDNVTGLTDLADIVAELDERVTALEEK